MVAVKAHQAVSFLKAIDRAIAAVLFYGPDAGLVAERGQALARQIATREKPEGEVIRLDDTDLENDSGRLAVELQMAPMFGGRKVVRAIPGRRLNTNLLKPLVEPGAIAGFLIVEAGNLRPDEALRMLFEKAATAAAVACYPDEGRDLDTVVREMLAGHKLDIATDARQLLVSRLGADRALTRGEIDKLALYVHGRRAVTVEDVEAIVGDASELAIDRILQAAAAGDAATALRECDRAVSSGESVQAIVLLAQRHFLRLHRVRLAMDQGRSLDDAVRTIRPPLHFKAKDALAAQTRIWTAAKLDAALALIATTAYAARLAGDLEAVLCERMLAGVARMARQ